MGQPEESLTVYLSMEILNFLQIISFTINIFINIKKKFYNLKLLKKDELKKLKDYNVVICSNSEYSQIVKEAKSLNFKKVTSYERFLK